MSSVANDMLLTRFFVYALGNLDGIHFDIENFRSQLTQQIREHLAGSKGIFLCTSDVSPNPLQYLAHFVTDEGLKKALLIMDETIRSTEDTMTKSK